jgi:hypothetical protein
MIETLIPVRIDVAGAENLHPAFAVMFNGVVDVTAALLHRPPAELAGTGRRDVDTVTDDFVWLCCSRGGIVYQRGNRAAVVTRVAVNACHCVVVFAPEAGDTLKAFLGVTVACMAQCPAVVLSSGRLGAVLAVVAASCRHSNRDVVRHASHARSFL